MKHTLSIILTLLFTTTVSFAATITVTSNADSGTGTLREAVTNANAGDEIVFASNVNTILLLDKIVLTKNVIITGDAVNTTVLKRNGTGTDIKRHFEIDSAVSVTFNNITLQDSYISCVGGAVYCKGNLMLNNCVILNNRASSSIGGVYCIGGKLNAYNTTFKNNMNGAICCNNAHFEGCTFSGNNGNNGGAIYIRDKSEVVIKNCLFEGNSASTFGGALTNYGNTTIDNCIFRKNTAINSEAAIGNSGSLVIINSVFDSNQSQTGGIFSNSHFSSITNSATFINCLFVNNILTGNVVNMCLGVLQNSANSSLTVINSTFADNKGIALAINSNSGLGTVNKGIIYLYNSIFWHNVTNAGSEYDIYIENKNYGVPDLEINAFNCLVGKTNSLHLNTSNLINTDPLFVGSGDYRLQKSSQAINAGNNSYIPDSILSDIASKPRILSSLVDLGAYEYQSNALAVSTQTKDNLKIYSSNHNIIIENATEPVTIYNATGQLVASGVKKEFYISETGVYLVCVNKVVYKIFVR